MNTTTTVYAARNILTMNPARPQATHVAVRDGRILGAGSLEELRGWGEHVLDERFADRVLMPGLVEGHSHMGAGTAWLRRYCGYFPASDHEGRLWPGAKSLDEVIAALSESAAALPAGAAPVCGWGFDPIYFGARRMSAPGRSQALIPERARAQGSPVSRHDLDRVSATRPVGLMHASGHILNASTRALERAGLLRTGIDHPGIPLGEDGLPTGELRGPEAFGPVLEHVGLSRSVLAGGEAGIRAFAQLCLRAGVTTATDLGASLTDPEVEMLSRVVGADDYPVRLVPLLQMRGLTPQAAVARAVALRERSSDSLRLGRMKITADGSIQGFTARLRWPGYYNGAPNGLWYTAPEAIREAYTLALQHGVQVHTHTNGDEATGLAIDCMEQALRVHPARDHRFMLQHVQLADAAQFRRIRALGMGVNLFANHHYYWGDQHRDITLGPERAERMNACSTALREGVPMAIHSDAPITPLGPLFTAWCAVNRRTATGRVLGEAERISVAEALQAITLGAAYSLGLDGEIGSIECGKRADFCVLADDPTAVVPETLKDVRICGTVQGGRVFMIA
ncbi:MAG: amidohydrolase [Burkholderiales bacterium]|nr:amidohydrolase [Burkholderiales bacterium]